MKTGRPRIEIDKAQFEKLCSFQCTLVEIASFFDCSDDTIERWCKREYKETFADVYKRKSAKGKISLRRTQFKLAEKSPAMAIFLGKNYLEQKDNIEYEDTTAMEKLDSILEEVRENAFKSTAK